MGFIFRITALLLLTSCTHLFFQPDHYLYAPPEDLNLNYENILFESQDKTRLHSWFFPSQKKKIAGVVGLFHGNAQNLSSHYISVSWLTQYGFDVWVWDYRGYGLSQGEAESKGIYEDSLAALSFFEDLSKKKNYPKKILVGQSLGGNILMRGLNDWIARGEEFRPDILVLDSTFVSYQKIAKDRLRTSWPLYPLSFLTSPLVSEKYSALNHLEKLTMPTLVMHGGKDQVIPFAFGEEVFEAIPSKKKHFWALPEGRHIESLSRGDKRIEEEFLSLIASLVGNSSS